MSVIDLSKVRSAENNLTAFLDSVCERHELDYAAYAGISTLNQTVYGFVNYPDEWQSHYIERHFQHKDPTLTVAGRSIAPVDWRRLQGEEAFQNIFSDASDFGISDQGLTIPVRGPFGDLGLFSVTRDCSDREWQLLKETILGDLQTAAVHLHDHVMQTDVLNRTLRHPSLSARETEILQWIAAGKSQQDVADIRMLQIYCRFQTGQLRFMCARSEPNLLP
jgi:hypothetical protein